MTHQAAPELLPCPFCKQKPRVSRGTKGSCQLHGDPYQAMRVVCETRTCPARPQVQAGDIYNGGEPKARLEAITLWNNALTRAAAPPTIKQATGIDEIDDRNVGEFFYLQNHRAQPAITDAQVREAAKAMIEIALPEHFEKYGPDNLSYDWSGNDVWGCDFTEMARKALEAAWGLK